MLPRLGKVLVKPTRNVNLKPIIQTSNISLKRTTPLASGKF
jgi:hypothetical protein